MDPLLLLIILGVGLYIYVAYFSSEPDELDRNGNPIRKSRKQLRR